MWKAMHRTHIAAKIAATLLIAAATMSFFVAMAMMQNNDMPVALIKWLFRTGSAWLPISLTAAATMFLLDIARVFFPAIRGTVWWSMGVAALFFAYGNYNYHHPKAVEIDITIEKPMERDLKIAVVSDLHLGYGTGKGELKKYVKLINSHNPDVILIAGDLIDNNLRPVRHERMEEELSQLRAPLGIYMAAGNHEYISNIDECEEFLSHTPIKMVRDSVISLPCGTQIALRNDTYNKKRISLKKLYKNIDHSKPVILVNHRPEQIEESATAGTDLMVCGHTHNGQVWPGNIIVSNLYKQSHGYRKWDNTHVWVSSGLSLWGPPVRIGTESDYGIITLRGRKMGELN